jgi:hypothetical protein
MATALRPLQSAVYAKLAGSASLMTLVSGVYDQVPEDEVFPYVTLGPLIETPDDAHDAQGLSSTLTVDIWSKAPGFGEAYDVFSEVDAALDRVPLAVAGFRDVRIKQAGHQAERDPDPHIRRVSAQYQIDMTKE